MQPIYPPSRAVHQSSIGEKNVDSSKKQVCNCVHNGIGGTAILPHLSDKLDALPEASSTVKVLPRFVFFRVAWGMQSTWFLKGLATILDAVPVPPPTCNAPPNLVWRLRMNPTFCGREHEAVHEYVRGFWQVQLAATRAAAEGIRFLPSSTSSFYAASLVLTWTQSTQKFTGITITKGPRIFLSCYSYNAYRVKTKYPPHLCICPDASSRLFFSLASRLVRELPDCRQGDAPFLQPLIASL